MGYLLCIKHNGKTFCWNHETEQIEEITSKPVAVKDCPEYVVFDLMRRLGREIKAIKEKED